jgi:hypothetical protein
LVGPTGGASPFSKENVGLSTSIRPGGIVAGLPLRREKVRLSASLRVCVTTGLLPFKREKVRPSASFESGPVVKPKPKFPRRELPVRSLIALVS